MAGKDMKRHEIDRGLTEVVAHYRGAAEKEYLDRVYSPAQQVPLASCDHGPKIDAGIYFEFGKKFVIRCCAKCQDDIISAMQPSGYVSLGHEQKD